MSWKDVIRRARKAAYEGKSPSTQAGEFVREEIEHVRSGKHRVSSLKQALAIALSKARRAGIRLARPMGGMKEAAVDGQAKGSPSGATKQESAEAVSTRSLSRHARQTAKKRGAAARRKSARKAVRTKGAAGRKRAARKAAATRARQRSGVKHKRETTR